MLWLGQKLMRPWFHLVAKRRSHELFIINVLLITLASAYLTELAGLSLALGAFVAGMLISETQYRHQVEEDIKPFREVLLGLFFITVGMQLDLHVVAAARLARGGDVRRAAGGEARDRRRPVAPARRVAGDGAAQRVDPRSGRRVRAGPRRARLRAVASSTRLLVQAAIAGMVLSMLAAPFLIQYSDRIVLRFARSEWMLRSWRCTRSRCAAIATERHVVVCGYGRTGQSLARFLGREGMPYVALDLDPERVREAAAAGDTVVFGDASRRETLIAAGAGPRRGVGDRPTSICRRR